MVVWVAPTNENAGPNQNWVVVFETSESAVYYNPQRRAVSHHRTKQKAISEAKKFGRKKGDNQVIIKNKDGSSRTEYA